MSNSLPRDKQWMVYAIRDFREMRSHRRPGETAGLCNFIWGSFYTEDMNHLKNMHWLDLTVMKPWVSDYVVERYVDEFCSKAAFGIQPLIDRPDVSVLSIWSGRGKPRAL